MIKARVKVIAVSGRGKAIHKLNDVVKDGQFPPGRFEELVKGGYLEVLAEGAAEPVQQDPPPPVDPPADPDKNDDQDPDKDDADNKKDEDAPMTEEEQEVYDEMTRNDLMDELKDAGVDFSKNASKAELYKLWKEEKARQQTDQT